jgi:hypothetical protein
MSAAEDKDAPSHARYCQELPHRSKNDIAG